MAFIPASYQLLTADEEGVIKLWDLHTNKLVDMLDLRKKSDKDNNISITRLLYVEENNMAVAAWGMGLTSIKVQPQKLVVAGKYRTLTSFGKCTALIEYLRAPACLVMTGEPDTSEKIMFWDLENSSSIRSWARKLVTSFCELRGLNKFAMGTKKGTIKIVDTTNIRQSQKDIDYQEIWNVHNSSTQLSALAWLSSQRLLISGSDDQTIKAYEISEKGSKYVKFTVSQMKGNGFNYVRSIATVAEKDTVFCTHNNNTITTWKVNKGLKALYKVPTSYTAEDGNGNCIIYSNNELIAAFKQSIYIWKISD